MRKFCLNVYIIYNVTLLSGMYGYPLIFLGIYIDCYYTAASLKAIVQLFTSALNYHTGQCMFSSVFVYLNCICKKSWANSKPLFYSSQRVMVYCLASLDQIIFANSKYMILLSQMQKILPWWRHLCCSGKSISESSDHPKSCLLELYFWVNACKKIQLSSGIQRTITTNKLKTKIIKLIMFVAVSNPSLINPYLLPLLHCLVNFTIVLNEMHIT